MAKGTGDKAATNVAANKAALGNYAYTLAALKRALAVVTAEAKANNAGEVPELEPGAYSLEVVIDINGDVNVAARTATKGKDKPTFSDEELAACCYAQNGDALKDALGLLRECSDAELKAKVEVYREARDKAAKKARRWEPGVPGSSAGAVTGNPAVIVRGRVGKHTLKLAVAST